MNLKDINKDKRYQGYIWMSNKKKPKVYNNEPLDFVIDDKSNPFIIEGMLFDKDSKRSYSIRNIDGHHIVNMYELKEEELAHNDTKFVAKRIEGHKTLYFRQRWREQEDDLCEGMKTKVPEEIIFIGFETNKSEEE